MAGDEERVARPAAGTVPVVILLETDGRVGAACVLGGERRVVWSNDAGRELLRRRPGLLEASQALQDLLAVCVADQARGSEASALAARSARREAAVAHRTVRTRMASSVWRLTARQGSVLELAAEGLATKEIASRLGCTSKTVEVHLGQVFRKAGVDSRAGLIAALWSDLEVEL